MTTSFLATKMQPTNFFPWVVMDATSDEEEDEEEGEDEMEDDDEEGLSEEEHGSGRPQVHVSDRKYSLQPQPRSRHDSETGAQFCIFTILFDL